MKISELKKGSHIHLMGICGTAMASLAGLLKDLGFQITGSDQNVYPPMSTQLQSLGIKIMEGYKKENLTPRPDFVVVGNVISKHFPEAEALLEQGIPYTSLPSALGDVLLSQCESVVIAGTHGKTTTTALVSWVAEQCGLQPGFLIGGIPENFPLSFRVPKADRGQKKWFVIEGDEYDTAFFDKVPKFVHYRPKFVILTSIEFDHADIYKDLDHVKAAFVELLKRIPEDGLLVYNGDDKNIQSILSHCRARKLSYGLKEGQFLAVERENIHGRNQFCVQKAKDKIADVAAKMFGPHNTMNILGAFVLATELGWPESSVLQGLATFLGVKRRQEVIGEPRGITIIEDFAHHPTAVELTLQGIKEKYPQRKVIAVFEPRSATSRRKIFQEDYLRAFLNADEIILPPAFNQDSLPESDRFSSEKLVRDLKKKGKLAHLSQDIDELVPLLTRIAKPKDIVLIMSNGGFGGIYTKLIPALQQN